MNDAIFDDVVVPAAVLDQEAFEHNIGVVADHLAPGVTLRVATKSLRCLPAVERVLERLGDRARGLMAYAPAEVAFLAERGHDDLLLAYPVARGAEARTLAEAARRVRVTVVCDDVAQLAVLGAAATAAGSVLDVALEIDGALRPHRRVHLGVRRSPLRDPAAAVALARQVGSTAGLRFRGVMLYEAQVAGLRDHDPHQPVLDPVRRWLRARSRPAAAARRASFRQALEQAGLAVELVNGGGTGSLVSSGHDGTCTEVTAGSAFFCPHLFDGCGLPLRPAAFFVLPVVRSPDPGWVTVHGGGFVASGGPGGDRWPVVHAPPGLEPTSTEGFGEVQTPLRVRSGPPPAPGSLVWCRHAKAGELCERFDRLHRFGADGGLAPWPTYRGEGLCAP